MFFSHLADYRSGFVGLFYPNLCLCCASGLLQGERYVCGHCLSDLPATDFHSQRGNPVERMFWGRAEVENVTSCFFFRKGNRVQTLIHQLKYKGQKEMGEYLGGLFGRALHDTVFAEVDVLVPVPLHPSKLRRRGYNQSEWIARGVGAELAKPIDTTSLLRRMASETQTHQRAYERWQNVERGFVLKSPDTFAGKHILLIDDVITTGATLEACIHVARQAPDIKVSVAALAVAGY